MNIQYLRKLTDEIFKADEKQRRYEANFRKFYDTISDLIFILDMDFRIIHVNKSVLNTLKTTHPKRVCFGIICWQLSIP